ncbi:hypothetical protein BGZ60DRAFT_215116 [Tricladium varicosporioides]|nr:hypothetical protein BGZ60DRAFT_215116 [Hymenoscyphus varicosporioides]
MKAAMMVPVASALGQLKWHWFREFKSLKAMEIFDEASRGTYGSIRLLITLRFWYLASIGALITIATLFIDTSVQNAIQLRLQNDTTNGSFIYRTNTFNFTTKFRRGFRKELPPSDMLSAITFAMMADVNVTTESPLWNNIAECYTGNCTFPTYQSLAVDYQCIETTTRLENSKYIHASNSTFYLDRKFGVINSTTQFQYPESRDFKGVGPLITRWLILANPNTLYGPPIGMECAFYWAVHTYKQRWSTHDIILRPDTCWINGSLIDSNESVCLNIIYSAPQRSLQNYFRLKDSGVIGEAINLTEPMDTFQSWDYSSIFMQGLLASVVDNNSSSIASKINQVAYNVAYSITNEVRRRPLWRNGTHHFYGKQYGTTYWSPDPYYFVRWGYMIVPFVLVVLSTFFFLATIYVTRHEPPWKTSQLAVILHGLWPQDLIELDRADKYADMRELSAQVQVKLVDTELGKMLVSKR